MRSPEEEIDKKSTTPDTELIFTRACSVGAMVFCEALFILIVPNGVPTAGIDLTGVDGVAKLGFGVSVDKRD